MTKFGGLRQAQTDKDGGDKVWVTKGAD